MRTKWEILSERADRLEFEAIVIRKQLEGLERTACNLKCAGCGEKLKTEGDFARHFTIPDERYLNLGWCPIKDREKVSE